MRVPILRACCEGWARTRSSVAKVGGTTVDQLTHTVHTITPFRPTLIHAAKWQMAQSTGSATVPRSSQSHRDERVLATWTCMQLNVKRQLSYAKISPL